MWSKEEVTDERCFSRNFISTPATESFTYVAAPPPAEFTYGDEPPDEPIVVTEN